jgi:hypothetical protein
MPARPSGADRSTPAGNPQPTPNDATDVVISERRFSPESETRRIERAETRATTALTLAVATTALMATALAALGRIPSDIRLTSGLAAISLVGAMVTAVLARMPPGDSKLRADPSAERIANADNPSLRWLRTGVGLELRRTVCELLEMRL